MGKKLWYVNVEGFKVEAETYDEAWRAAFDYVEMHTPIIPEVTDVTLCEEEYCSECLDANCKDNPTYKGISNEKDR